MTEPTLCADCGAPTSGGYRCKPCHGKFIKRQSLLETLERDSALLGMVDGEKLSGQRLATRLGISRVRASQSVRLARKRHAERSAAGII